MACLSVIWLFVIHGNGLGFADSEDFYHACDSVAALVGEALEGDADEQQKSLQTLSQTLDKNAMSLIIFYDRNAEPFYTYGTAAAQDASLLQAVETLGGEGLVSHNGRSLFVQQLACKGHQYELQLFGSEHAVSYHTLKLVLVFAGITLLFTILASVYLTNRFLTRFVFRKIEAPLDILAKGVQEIGAGNLDYRIVYLEQDEFAPICAQFNEMAMRLKRSVEETQRHEESRKELMASLSHDLRSPLTSILAYVEGLLDGVANTPEKQRMYLTTVQSKAEQLRDMVSQIFLYSKMELEAFPVHCVPMQLDEEIRALVHELSGDYAAKGLAVDTDILQPSRALADPELLRRCIVNILDNSAKYKTADHGRAMLSVAPCAAGIRLTLTDDGPGVAPQAQEKLFDVFYRSDPARSSSVQGSGLGLAIVARAVQRMNGTVTARSVQPHGLCVEITLPEEAPNHAKDTDR